MFQTRSVRLHLASTLAISALLLSSAQSLQALAQADLTLEVPTEILIAQDQGLDAFFSSQYDYWDASILSDFWGLSITETKSQMGFKILNGPAGKALLAQDLTDARISALGSLEELRYFVEQQYTYEDAELLADFWGEPSAYEAKLRIELNLILDQQQEIDLALALANG